MLEEDEHRTLLAVRQLCMCQLSVFVANVLGKSQGIIRAEGDPSIPMACFASSVMVGPAPDIVSERQEFTAGNSCPTKAGQTAT